MVGVWRDAQVVLRRNPVVLTTGVNHGLGVAIGDCMQAARLAAVVTGTPLSPRLSQNGVLNRYTATMAI